MNHLGKIIIFSIIALTEMPVGVSAQWSDWIAPEWTDTLINPFVGDETATLEGKQLFETICFVCHGKKGKGDGFNAKNLKKHPADLTSKKVQKQMDGTFFWKISEGNPPMLSFKSSLSVEQRWKVVSYVRELAKLYPEGTGKEKAIVKYSLDAQVETPDNGVETTQNNFQNIQAVQQNVQAVQQKDVESLEEIPVSSLNNEKIWSFSFKEHFAWMIIGILTLLIVIILLLFYVFYILGYVIGINTESSLSKAK